jgi:hypothetical protein
METLHLLDVFFTRSSVLLVFSALRPTRKMLAAPACAHAVAMSYVTVDQFLPPGRVGSTTTYATDLATNACDDDRVAFGRKRRAGGVQVRIDIPVVRLRDVERDGVCIRLCHCYEWCVTFVSLRVQYLQA